MFIKFVILLLIAVPHSRGQPKKCDQTPPQAKVRTPSENKGIFRLYIERDTQNLYLPDQTYVLILSTTNTSRPFRWFMITAEDPEVDDSSYDFEHKSVDVGNLKTLDTDRQSRYSERCFSSVENTDNSDKYRVEIHWVSPKQSDKTQKVRLRAMIAENEETWYTGENLTIVLEKNDNRPIDSPPYLPTKDCSLCSEARYEVIFQGHWSRLSHPRHYPSKPDDNGYSHMVGASHSYDYILWQQGFRAREGLKLLAEEANSTLLEREIIDAISQREGTRTLIRGKKRHHPNMFKPSHSLFRVDKIHHLFSIVVAMRPSPDWFLGASRFELCTELGWLESSQIPLYPWDAGTMDGDSYESVKTMTQPVDNVERVAVGSFNRESPFYQMNLNDLKPFAYLKVKRLDVYPVEDDDCLDEEHSKDNKEQTEEAENLQMDTDEEPKMSEYKQNVEFEDECVLEDMEQWSDCVASNGICGPGIQTRLHYNEYKNKDNRNYDENAEIKATKTCRANNMAFEKYRSCYIYC